jgi:DNA-binding transcriptional LysR family regulator
LTHEAWILREQGSGTRLTFDQAMRHHRSALNIRLELEHTEAIKRAVESGLGLAASRAWRCATHFGAAAWCRWKPRTWTWRGSFTFIWHKEVPDLGHARVSGTVPRLHRRGSAQRRNRAAAIA